MHVKDFMSTDVQTCHASTPADDAWTQMRTKRIHHLVVTAMGRVLGVVSERDLGGPRGYALRSGRRVVDLMSRQPMVASPATTLREAAQLMRGRGVGCLPVFDGKKLVGIVTTSDLLELIARGRTIERKMRRQAAAQPA
jgi:acetoin utilization protein AcuB